MINHCVRACVLVLSVVVLVACIPARNVGQPTTTLIHPISTHAGFGTSDGGSFDYSLTSSTNCAVSGEPLLVTLALTNTGTQAYRDELPVSIIDLQATGVLTTTLYTWYWSDTTPVTDQVRSINLAPNESLQMQWRWTVDPRLRTAPLPKRVNIVPLIRYHDPSNNGQISDIVSGGRLGIPVDETPAYSCATTP